MPPLPRWLCILAPILLVLLAGWLTRKNAPVRTALSSASSSSSDTPQVESGDGLSLQHKQLELCGQLCNLSNPIKPGEYIGTVKAEVNCDLLFSSDLLDEPADHPPKRWEDLSPDLHYLYSHGGKVMVVPEFYNEADMGGAQTNEKVFSESEVGEWIADWKAGKPRDTYSKQNCSAAVDRAAAEVGVEGKTILVIGSQSPWLEAVLLARNPARVVTLEYGLFSSKHPKWQFLRPQEFRKQFQKKTLPAFDLIFSYSSVEHSGLGRYGDALNPWGDIITIARAWCVAKPTAKLILAVPTIVKEKGGKDGQDRVRFNAAKVYGPRLYPFLTTNWRFVWPTTAEFKDYRECPNEKGGGYQPVFVFEKNP